MNYLAGGKMGDFIHSMIVCKYRFDETGEKANVYLSNGGHSFEFDLEFTHNQLKPLINHQPWIQEFEIHSGQTVDVDLTAWRSSNLLYKTNWLEIYSNYYLNDAKIPNEYKWITCDVDNTYRNSLMINRSLKTTDDSKLYVYNDLISQYDEAYFVCFDIKQYYQFPLHYKTRLIVATDLYDFFVKIGSCHAFIGNQSGPFAWASSMNIPRAVELLDIPDRNHYINDSNYYDYFNHF